MRELLGQKEALEQVVERLEKKIEFLQGQKRQSNPRVIESLQKLVIGMACAGYRFDPSRGRNSATSDIRSDLDKLGIHLDDETILARLREAAELLPVDARVSVLIKPFFRATVGYTARGRLPARGAFA
jgi:hypothetical protein